MSCCRVRLAGIRQLAKVRNLVPNWRAAWRRRAGYRSAACTCGGTSAAEHKGCVTPCSSCSECDPRSPGDVRAPRSYISAASAPLVSCLWRLRRRRAARALCARCARGFSFFPFPFPFLFLSFRCCQNTEKMPIFLTKKCVSRGIKKASTIAFHGHGRGFSTERSYFSSN